MRKIVFGFAVVAAVASALAQAVAPAIENEEQAYGAVYGRIVERIRLWPGLAPHETRPNRGISSGTRRKRTTGGVMTCHVLNS